MVPVRNFLENDLVVVVVDSVSEITVTTGRIKKLFKGDIGIAAQNVYMVAVEADKTINHSPELGETAFERKFSVDDPYLLRVIDVCALRRKPLYGIRWFGERLTPSGAMAVVQALSEIDFSKIHHEAVAA